MGESQPSRLWSASTLVDGMELVGSHADTLEISKLSEQEMQTELSVSWLNLAANV